MYKMLFALLLDSIESGDKIFGLLKVNFGRNFTTGLKNKKLVENYPLIEDGFHTS